MIEEQNNDKELLNLFKTALTPESEKVSAGYLIKDNTLVKKWFSLSLLDHYKETQVCHINMLKAYHEKPKPELVTLNNKLGLENTTYSEGCADLEAEKEEDSQSEVRLGDDQQPIKL